ncbi:MAG: 23S rRNA (adenine(2503)-C(2))-methyltransferase RlmN [Trueperaceae bacterium]|nr:23S rRNA (adenine(2503)-C(2))-methyltransferase RlmN [Trueperaceae bacterium]
MEPRRTPFDLPIDALPAPEGEAYRRAQLTEWLYVHGARDFEAMTTLPKGWRAALAAEQSVSPFDDVRRFPSWDGSVRYLFTLADGQRTEAVYMPYAGRKTVCVSSMVGCPAGCAFCATGALGFGRNLTRGEIVAQLLAVAWFEGFAPRELRNVVLMGMGEALLNYDAAIGAIRTWIDPRGLAMSPRRITLSTVGLPARIRRLAGEGLPLVLAVSLHAPDEATRRRIIPTAHAHALDDIVASLHDWQAAGGRRVTVEYTMLDGVNDAPAQAGALATLLAGLVVHVNLIPFNPWPGSGFEATPRERVRALQDVLVRAGVSTSVRFSRGRDTGGACGQLALREGATAA